MANLFSDGFEDGTTNAWSSVVTDSGKLSVSTGSKLNGNYGMQLDVTSTAAKYVRIDNSSATRYRCRYYFNLGTGTMVNYANTTQLWVYKGTTPVFSAVIHRLSGVTNFKAIAYKDNASTVATALYTVNASTTHYIELDFIAATAPGANNGSLALYIDDSNTPKETLTGVDNDTLYVDNARLGLPNGVDSGNTGLYYFDDFASNNDGSVIGAYSANQNMAVTITGTAGITATDLKGAKTTSTITGTATIAELGKKSTSTGATITGTANVTATDSKGAKTIVVIPGTASITIAVKKANTVNVTITGISDIIVAVKKTGKTGATISGTSVILLGIKKGSTNSFTLTGNSSIEIIDKKGGTVTISLTGIGTITSTVKKGGFGSIVLSGNSDITTTATIPVSQVVGITITGNSTILITFKSFIKPIRPNIVYRYIIRDSIVTGYGRRY